MNNHALLLKVIFCLGVLLLLGFKGQAQMRQYEQLRNLNGGPLIHYRTAIGARLGPQYGLTAKRFLREGNALEALLTRHYDKKGITGTLMYEWHRNAFEAKGLLWYYGAGFHVGYYKYNEYFQPSEPERHARDGSFVEAGVDGIIGLEYGFAYIPLALSVDFKPYLSNVSGHLGGIDAALSIKYAF
jgi:hypothetical protein